jgi:RNA polymerase sigma-70 factor (ECF subfamily)
MDRLLPLVYHQLRSLARQRLARESQGHPLRPTELVHEVYLRLVDSDLSATDRSHFYLICSQVMRHILVDHARERLRQKRGGGAEEVSLHSLDIPEAGSPERLIAIHEALDKLAEVDNRKAQAVELVLFGGLELDAAAEALGVSNATVRRDVKAGKAWLYNAILSTAPPGARGDSPVS